MSGDIETNAGLKSNVKIFADDTSLFSVMTDSLRSSNLLNIDLGLIEDWVFSGKCYSDPSKQAIEVLFSSFFFFFFSNVIEDGLDAFVAVLQKKNI